MASKWWTLLVVCLAIFMLLLDITIVNVALPSIQHELGSSFEDLQWVVDAYALALAALLLASGSIADLLGRRRIFVVGLLLFVCASLLCGLAGSPTMLNVSRGLQGIGGAMMFATSLALIAQEFAPDERGTAFGIWGATTGFAVAVGPLVGGVLTDGLGWEWIFLVNVPIGLITAAITVARVPESERDPNSRIDWAGLVTFSLGLFCLVFALIRGNDHGWTSAQILALLGASGAADRRIRGRRAATAASPCSISTCSESPRSPVPRSWRSPCTRRCSRCSSTSSSTCRTCSATRRSRPECASSRSRSCPSSPRRWRASSPSASRCGGSSAPASLLVGIGLLLMSGIKPSDDWTTLLAGFLVAGVGIGFINPPLATAAIGVVEPRRAGAASGINSTFRQVGTAVGIAGLGALLQSKVTDNLDAALAGARLPRGAADHLAEAVSSGGGAAAARAVPPEARELVATAARKAYIDGFNEILVVAAVLALVGAVLALLLVRQRDFVTFPADAAP